MNNSIFQFCAIFRVFQNRVTYHTHGIRTWHEWHPCRFATTQLEALADDDSHHHLPQASVADDVAKNHCGSEDGGVTVVQQLGSWESEC